MTSLPPVEVEIADALGRKPVRELGAALGRLVRGIPRERIVDAITPIATAPDRVARPRVTGPGR